LDSTGTEYYNETNIKIALITNETRPAGSVSHFKRSNLDYIVYSDNDPYSGTWFARSSNGPLGPYIVQDTPFTEYGFLDPSVVKDVDGENDVLIIGEMSVFDLSVFVLNIIWGDDGWPMPEENFSRKIQRDQRTFYKTTTV